MTDILLRDAVRAIKAKISAAADQASPEELAYLGTAIDRIGGRATLLELEELADALKAEVTALVEAERATLTTDVDAIVAAGIATMTASRDGAAADIEAARVSTLTDVNASLLAARQEAADGVADIQAATSTALDDISAAAAGTVGAAGGLSPQSFFLGQL